MKLDVYLTPGELVHGEVQGRVTVVIDVLRATSTIVEALGAGARAVYPVVSIEEALRLANTLGREDVLLCGERRCVRIEGFDLGNSPLEFTPERVAGKTLVMSTTNGTQVMAQTAGAERVLIASALNAGAVARTLAEAGSDAVIVCAGREKHFALEDAVVAGHLARRLAEILPGPLETNDGALAALALAGRFPISEGFFLSTGAGQLLEAADLTADLAVCAQIDRHDIVPVFRDRHITLGTR
jgi:2-phosphosulfolactate phosphatase